MPTLQTYRGVYLWHYIPSLPAAILFAVLFALVTVAHGWKMISTRMWFCAPFVIGGIFEIAGYIGRTTAYDATGEMGPYLVQGVFLVLAPILFAASLYMVYSRVVRSVHGEAFSLMPPRWTTRIFVIGDLTCLNIQGAGAGLLFKPKTVQIGNWIVTGGLALQLALFVGFIWCCVTFQRRFRAHVKRTGVTIDVPWRTSLYMLYGTSLAIMVRNVFRVIEFVGGQDNYLFTNEWATYVFDAVPMLFVMVGFFIWYPSQLRIGREDSRGGGIPMNGVAMDFAVDRDSPPKEEFVGQPSESTS